MISKILKLINQNNYELTVDDDEAVIELPIWNKCGTTLDSRYCLERTLEVISVDFDSFPEPSIFSINSVLNLYIISLQFGIIVCKLPLSDLTISSESISQIEIFLFSTS